MLSTPHPAAMVASLVGRQAHCLLLWPGTGRAIPFEPSVGVSPLTVPTTYLWGAADPSIRRRPAELTAQHVEAPYRFEVLDAGHWLPETRPDEVAQAVLDRVAHV